MGLDKNNGEFWMDYVDMDANFDTFYVSYLTGDIAKALTPPEVEPKHLEVHSYHGFWKKSSTMELGTSTHTLAREVIICKIKKYNVNLLNELYNVTRRHCWESAVSIEFTIL